MKEDSHSDYFIGLGKRVQKLREQAGLDQKQFAFEAGISRTQLHMIEKGETNPRLRTMLKIAAYLGVELHELLRF